MSSVLKNANIFLLSLVPVILIFIPNTMFFPFITGRGFLFRVIVEIALGLYVALCLSDKSYLPKKNLLNISLGIFVAVIFIADIFSPYPIKALWSNFERMEGFVVLAHLATFFIISSSIFSIKDWKRFFYTSIGVSVFLSYYSILQLYKVLDIHQGGARLDATMGNAAYFAAYLLFHIFFTILLFISDDRKNSKGIFASVFGGSLWFILFYLWQIFNSNSLGNKGFLLFLISIALSVFCSLNLFSKKLKEKPNNTLASGFLYILIILNLLTFLYYTATRGAIIGLIGGVIIGSVFIIFREKTDKLAKNISISILLLIFSAISVFFVFKDSNFVKDSPVLSRFASISWNDTKTQARSYVWPMAIEGLKEKPLFGWGQDGFIYVFSKYYNPKLWSHEPWFDRAHNSFLDWLIAGGILGFLAYISLYINSLWMLWRSKISEKEKGVILGLVCAYSFQSIFVFDNLVSYIFFFSLLAFISKISISEKDSEKKDILLENKNKILWSVMLSLVLVYFVNAPGYFQNKTLVNVLNVAGIKDGDLVSCTSIKEQMDEAGKKIRVCKDWKPTFELFEKALAYNSFGTLEVLEHVTNLSYSINANPEIPVEVKSKFADKIIKEYQKQIEKNPLDSRSRLFFGSYLATIGFENDARLYFEDALKLSPTKQSVYMKLGELNLRRGDSVSSIEYFKKAYELDTNYSEALYQYVLALVHFKQVDKAKEMIKLLEQRDPSFSEKANELLKKVGY